MEAEELLDALDDMLEEIEADNFFRDSGLCGGRGTCHHDALQPSRGGGGNNSRHSA